MSTRRLQISPAASFSVSGHGVDVRIRGRADGMVISPELFALLARFADAAGVEDVIVQSYPGAADSAGGEAADCDSARAAREALDELASLGVLGEPLRPEQGADRSGEERHAAALAQIDDARVLLHRIEGDLHALGPGPASTAASVELGDVIAGLLGVHAAIDAELSERTQQRVAAIAGDEPLRLHLGAADIALDGWVSIDIHPAPLAWNLARPLPFADATARFVYSAHTLEHLYFPHEAYRLLGEVRRVLRGDDGVLRLVVPDIEALARAYAAGSTDVFTAIAGHVKRGGDSGGGREGSGLAQLLAYAGAPLRLRKRWYDHKFGYDYETLAGMLGDVGFTRVKRCGYMGSEHPELRIDDRSAGATSAIAGASYSLFIEASARARA